MNVGEEDTKKKKKEEEEDRLLRPWLSPAKPSILRKESKWTARGGAGGEGATSPPASAAPAAAAPAAAPSAPGDEAGGKTKQQQQQQEHHIAFAPNEPAVYPDFAFAPQRKLVVHADGTVEAPVLQNQPQVTDVCERLYAEAIAKQRLTQARVEATSRRIVDDASVPEGAPAAAYDEEEPVDPRSFDPECTFKPVISAKAAGLQFKDWEQFMDYRNRKTQLAKNRWVKKQAEVLKERDEKGMQPKFAKMSLKLLEYKAKKGMPHRGPLANYDYYLGKFILRRTSPEKVADETSDGDSQERRRRSTEYGHQQRELTQRLYEDAVGRVASRQVVERARIAADRAKLFQPMTNERLLAKLKELNPEHDADGLHDEMNVETRLLSQGESYRLRKERRKNQHEMDATKDCTFTPHTNPHSRQLLQQWAKRVDVIGNDPSAVASVMRVDRNLADSQDYAPLNPGGPAHTPRGGTRIYANEAEALAALESERLQQQQQQYNRNNTSASLMSSGSSGGNKPRHIPDPDGYFERIKMRQMERERLLAEKRRQKQQADEGSCTFRPLVAPLTAAICKIKDDKEFGPENAARAHREILLPPHMRPKTAQWGESKSPRKLPRGLQQQQQYTMSAGSGAGGEFYRGAAATYNIGGGPVPSSAHNSAARRTGPTGMTSSSAGSASRSARAAAAAASARYTDPVTGGVDNSEHFLADLEHELQGVISSWQSDGL